jgi:hypothetical protein
MIRHYFKQTLQMPKENLFVDAIPNQQRRMCAGIEWQQDAVIR